MRWRWSKKLTIGAVILLLLFFHYLGVLRPVEKIFLTVVQPVQRGLYNFAYGIYDFVGNYSQCRDLIAENAELKSDVTNLQVAQINFAELQEENEYLRQELDFVRQSNQKIVFAQIIGKPLLQNNLLIIDRGSAAGLRVGLPVLAGQGILVGKIFEVETNRAYVALLTNTNSSVAVSLNNVMHTQGVVQGSLGLSLLMDLIPPGEEIAPGDLVYTSGLEENITARYLVGELTSILSQAGELYQQAEVQPAFDYDHLKILSIVLPE
jgi:rod shape-determining protein MreC